MGSIKVYSSTIFKKEIKILNSLSNNLSQPSVAKLLLVPTKTTRQHENGTEIEETTPDDFETTVYQEYIKKYIKDTTSLERPIHALYNIVW